MRVALLRKLLPTAVLVASFAGAVYAQNDPDCTLPQGVFPTVPAGQGTQCDGHSGVLYDVENGKRTNYRWDIDSVNGQSCWSSVNYSHLINSQWPDNPFVDPDAPDQGGSPPPPDNDPCRGRYDQYGFPINAPYGFRPPISPLAPPGIGDFLPPSSTIGGGSHALVPSGSSNQSAWWNDATRETLHGAVDFVTGLPLAKVDLLELPFGGTNFKLSRTRSGLRIDQAQLGYSEGDNIHNFASAADQWWDWDGQGWMIGENPLLLVDSAVPDLVGNNPRTTWFVLDAHHSIPFQLIESTGIYAAPPRFRAKLEHNGTWDTSTRSWAVDQATGDTLVPTQMDIYLYEGALKYTYVILRSRQDPALNQPTYVYDENASGFGNTVEAPSALHDRPFLPEQMTGDGWDPFAICQNPGLGLPYLALCVSIEDQYGHMVEINYSDVIHKPVDYLFGDNGHTYGTDGTECVECGQSCARIGMIRSVKLKSENGQGTGYDTHWSLLYAHRALDGKRNDVDSEFLDDAADIDDAYFRSEDLWGGYQIDRIYVYKVDGDNPDPEVTIGSNYRLVVHSNELLDLDGSGPGSDPLAELLNETDGNGLSNNWTFLVQNHFVQRDNDLNDDVDGVWSGGLKLMTTVQSRIADPEYNPTSGDAWWLAESKKHWVFQHGDTYTGGAFAGPLSDSRVDNQVQWLSRIFTPLGVTNVLSSPTLRDDLGFFNRIELDNLVYLTNPDTGSELTPEELDTIGEYASYEFGHGSHDDNEWPEANGSQQAPSHASLVSQGYLLNLDPNDPYRVMTDMHFDVVGSAAVPDANGVKRYYRINRLRVSPFGLDLSGHEDSERIVPNWWHLDAEIEHRSLFVHPFSWHAYAPNVGESGAWGHPESVGSPDLTKVRWITVVDEFAERADLFPTEGDIDDGYGEYEGDESIKKTQVSRRIIELSPSGHKLRDRTWEYSEDGVVRSGGGLGEQFIYQTVEDYFAGTGNPLPEVIDDSTGDIQNPERGNDPFSSIRNEILSVEYRSIGWSAGELMGAGDPNSTFEYYNGFTRFTEYKAFHPLGQSWNDYDVTSEELIPLSSRVQEVAQGFHRGSDFRTNDGSGFVHEHNNQDLLYTNQVFRDPESPSDVIGQVEFVRRATSLLSEFPDANYSQTPADHEAAGFRVTRTFVERDNSDETILVEERPVTSRMGVGVPRQVYPGSPLYYPIEREFYDENGNPVWSCTGQLRDPENPTANTTDEYESLIFTYYVRDDDGRSLHTVVDANAEDGTFSSSINGASIQYGGWPQDENGNSWRRISSSSNNPLTYVTSFVYDRYAPGLCDIYFPNGRRWARRVFNKIESPRPGGMEEYAREYILNDLELVDGQWATYSEGQVNDYRSTDVVIERPSKTRTVTFGDLSDLEDTLRIRSYNEPDWYLKSAVQVGMDSNGRLQDATLLERSPSGALLAVGTKEINDLGELYREQEIDETITIQTKNSLGQVLRVYQGTEDRVIFDYDGNDNNGNPLPPSNMILLERTEYGSGVNDAWQPTVVRTYDRSTSWAQDLFGHVDSIADTEGAATVVSYDWQGRAVRTDTYERGVPTELGRLSTSLVYLDYLDRPYLEVNYGKGTLDLDEFTDPGQFVDAQLFPSVSNGDLDEYQIARLFNVGTTPRSVTQNIYSIDGTLIERRTYDTAFEFASNEQSVPYHAEFTYNGRGGNQVFAQSPGGSLVFTQYDGMSRVSSTITMLPSQAPLSETNTPDLLTELSRTDYVYDPDGNVVDTKHWVRVKDDGVAKLGSTNAVRTRSLNWYNAQKRLLATAELGTETVEGYKFNDVDLYDNHILGPGDDGANYPIPHWDYETGTTSIPAGLEDALVSIFEYDKSGNKIRSVDPNGIVTEYEFSPANRMIYKTENAAAPEWEEKRMTGNVYQYGRLVEMNLVTADNRLTDIAANAPPVMGDIDVSPGDPADQIDTDIHVSHRTRLQYGAEIVRRTTPHEYLVVSRNNKLIGSMHLPNEATGDPNDDIDVFLRYTYSGQIAERYNGAGEAFRYMYDELGRLTSVEAGTWDPADGYPDIFVPIDPVSIDPAPGTLVIPEPADQIGFITYEYDERGNLSDVIAYTHRDETDRVQLSHNQMEYFRDVLTAELQLHGDGNISDPDTPRIDYAWDYEPTEVETSGRTGHHRLNSIEYPVPDANTNRRLLSFNYGATGSAEDLLSRLAEIDSSIGTTELADFVYSGDGRRIALHLKGNKITRDHRISDEVGLAGLDRFGRTNMVRFHDNTSQNNGVVLYEAIYSFDKVGNRLGAEITQVDVGGVPAQERSVVSTYDDLYRLIGTQMGDLQYTADDDGDGFVTPYIAGTPIHEDTWNLDPLGNWVGETNSATGEFQHGRHTRGIMDEFGVPWAISTHSQYSQYEFGVSQSVSQRDSIESLGLFEMYEGNTATAEEQTVEPVYDGAGRIMFDGEYVYQYDNWGRLVQINEADYDPLSPPVDETDVIVSAMGPMLKHYMYDGFGRLIRTESPVSDNDGTALENQSTHFYYDGARRIQEIIVDPVSNLAGAALSGDSGLQQLADNSTPLSNPDPSNTPMALQKGQTPSPISRNILREYVWGPGDNGFDEILLQTDETDKEYWCIQDGGGDLVAMATVAGQVVNVVRQWTYDAYGAVLSADHLGASIESHIGHKGLFLDRLDVNVVEGTDESPGLVPYAHAMYQNRNRSYSPGLGRFLQMDPNGTAMALLSTTASHGRGFGAVAIAFSMEQMYGDGLNLYQYLGSNPWTNVDPLGLSSDPFDIIDEIIDEHIGSITGFTSAIGKEAVGTAIMAARIASYLPFPGVSIVGDLALYAMGEQSGAELATALALGIIPGGKIAGKLFKGLGKLGASAFKSASHYAARGAGFLASKAKGLFARAKRIFTRVCGCFAASTVVLTANGAVPIVDIDAGHEVLSAPEDGVSAEYSSAEVGEKYVIYEAPQVLLALEHEDQSVEVLSTTDDHPFHVVFTNEWTRVDDLVIGDELSTITGTATVKGVFFTSKISPVYNMSVPGSSTYYVGELGVWVHNTNDRCLMPGVPGAFRDARKTMRKMRKAGHDVQAHHVIEKRMLKAPGLRGNSADDMIGVVLSREEHQRITNELRRLIPYGSDYSRMSLDFIRGAYQEAYSNIGRTDLYRSIESYLK